MRIAILGAGRVGRSLGAALSAKHHQIVYGVRQPKSPGAPNSGEYGKTVGAAIVGAEVVILATPWTATEALVCEHAPALTGKIVIDATTPLNASSSRLALGFDSSGSELLQSHAQGATFFKAFNAVGEDAIVKPLFPQGRAVMFVAGPKGPQKQVVLGLASDIGFEAVDAGELRAARLLEPLGMLWLELAAQGRKGDFAFALTSRDPVQPQAAHPCAVVALEIG